VRASYSATVTDIDFDRLMICPRRQADDRTRVLRELKTKKSRTAVPITHETATVLRNYLRLRWRANPQGLLFPNRIGRPGKRANIVKFGLHPILKQLGLPTHRAGLHAFRHGLGTALPIRGHRPQSCSAPYATATSKPRCGFTFTRTPTHSGRRSQTSNHYNVAITTNNFR
jgi:integrase